MTWFLPTYKRPQRCQEALDSIAKGGPSKGVVVVDGVVGAVDADVVCCTGTTGADGC